MIIMASKVKEKLNIFRKDETKCCELIKDFKKSLNLWFLYGTVNNTIFKEVLNSCVEVILHGLMNEVKKIEANTNVNALYYDSSPPTSNSSLSINNNSKNGKSRLNINEEHKIIDDFEWVRNAVSLRLNSANTPPRNIFSIGGVPPSISSLPDRNLLKGKSSVALWLHHNLTEHNLCGFVQYLVNDKELLEEHYYEGALLRQEKYVTILVIGLTAFETQQYGMLSRIDAVLDDTEKVTRNYKRCNSEPNAILLPKRNFETRIEIASTSQYHSDLGLVTIRKTKSLPEFINKTLSMQSPIDYPCFEKVIARIELSTSPQDIPQKVSQTINFNINPSDSNATTSSSGSFFHHYDDNLPTTSQAYSNRSKSPLSNYTLNSNNSTTPSLLSSSVSSVSSKTRTKCIQLINTDNIKIWTDHSWDQKQKNVQQKQQEPTISSAINTPLTTTKTTCKSFSPFNSLFSSLFGTPPSYTTWFVDHDARTEREATETAIESIIPEDNNIQNRNCVMEPQQQSCSSLGASVFDKFLPIDGKKLKTRKSQNLFDDNNSTMDCSGINMLMSAGNLSVESSSSSMTTTSKNCQSLTKFLQMSHLARNNTDLEKENAHFRISEAIISAIEHIKWNKRESQEDKSCCAATDCLAPQRYPLSSSIRPTPSDVEDEHIPYAELEEVSYDQLSAEVVGLSLISKFDEKHLPKVSELKWLVSDDDTPQKLLPMPDLTSSSNPDDHVMHSATRGTRYWAPPRQQIIFTDHPSPNRKELLKKQNNRCAGCGMRVSPEYIQSFRYCTYLGKYHCTGCHRNQISATPGKILQAWDFKCYPVSVFAYRLLEQMYAYPLFYVPDLNPALYIRCKSLLSARNKRLQLKYVKDFIRTCRFASHEQNYFDSVPYYITADVDNWSMSDFIDARTKCLHRSIDELISKCEKHIFNCVLCTARGFLCEYCHDDVVIYPWGLRIERCDHCGTCFHRNCWKSMSEKCCRCQRIDNRQYETNDII